MWILSLEWLLLAVTVFWVMGASKRIKRLRAAAKSAFTALDEQFAQTLEALRGSAADSQVEASRASTAMERRARTALLSSANLLQAALGKARQQPLNPEVIASVDSSWQSLQVAWHAYVQQDVDGQDAVQVLSPDSQAQRWIALMAMHQHQTDQFNTSVIEYNRAIAQFPACILARMAGLKPARTFQQDAAPWAQQMA